MERKHMTNRNTLTERVVRPCHDCGGKMIGTRQNYQYTESGLSNVRLENILVFECECGRRSPEIQAIAELHLMLALELLKKPALLAGEEIRFLRKMTGLNQRELAEIMGVDPTTPSKWESAFAGKENDRLIRTVCLLGIIQHTRNGRIAAREGTRSALESFRNLDVRELLKSIEDREMGPRLINLENDPTPCGEGWFLPSSSARNVSVF